jgi:hypothetical protein
MYLQTRLFLHHHSEFLVDIGHRGFDNAVGDTSDLEAKIER